MALVVVDDELSFAAILHSGMAAAQIFNFSGRRLNIYSLRIELNLMGAVTFFKAENFVKMP